MKVSAVSAGNRRREFEVVVDGDRRLVFPYALAAPPPTSTDRVQAVYPDPELGCEGFTYLLGSGSEGTVHVDSVLEYNEDPDYLADLDLHRLTVLARDRYDESGLSARQVARRLGTSVSQLYRLLDPANSTKSMRQLLALLHVLGYDIDVTVVKRPARTSMGGILTSAVE